jgi:hypothetical protein
MIDNVAKSASGSHRRSYQHAAGLNPNGSGMCERGHVKIDRDGVEIYFCITCDWNLGPANLSDARRVITEGKELPREVRVESVQIFTDSRRPRPDRNNEEGAR